MNEIAFGFCSLALAMVAGCAAGDRSTVAIAQNYGRAVVTLDPGNPNHLTLTMMNVGDLGYNFDRGADRAEFVQSMLSTQCGTPTVVDTRVVETSRNGAMRQYILNINCPNGSSKPAPP